MVTSDDDVYILGSSFGSGLLESACSGGFLQLRRLDALCGKGEGGAQVGEGAGLLAAAAVRSYIGLENWVVWG